VAQAIAEKHHAQREVMLAKPVRHLVVLDVGPGRHINNQIAQVLPVADNVDGAWAHLWVRASDGYVSCKRAVDAEHNRLGVSRQHGHVELNRAVVAFDDHLYLVHAQRESLPLRDRVHSPAVVVGYGAR